jgi:Neocarzinostatin family
MSWGVRCRAWAVAVAVTAGGLVAVPRPADAAPAITVSPATDLVAGSRVSVTGVGFVPGSQVLVAQCRTSNRSDSSACSATGFSPAITSATGAFSVTLALQPGFASVAGNVNCTQFARSCGVGAITGPRLGIAARAPVTFAAGEDPPAERGEISVDADDLEDGDVLNADLFSWAPWARVRVGTCTVIATSPAQCTDIKEEIVDGRGELTTQVVGRALFVDRSGAVRDCINYPHACAFTVWDVRSFSSTVSRAPIVFRPALITTVSPSTDLVDGQRVRVSGSGTRPNGAIRLVQCGITLFGHEACLVDREVVVEADASGAFAVDMTVEDDIPLAAGSISCLDECWLEARIESFVDVLPLQFRPAGTVFTGYSEAEFDVVFAAKRSLGLDDDQFQRQGAWLAAWLAGIAGLTPRTPGPVPTDHERPTVYGRSELEGLGGHAAARGVTVTEMQRFGSLLLAYLVLLG